MNNLREKYKTFLDEYSDSCDVYAIKYIKDNFWRCRRSFDIPDILMQVYSELGVYNTKDNIYNNYLNKIKSIFDINCNILEVGGGMIPAFANIVSSEQIKIGNGTITVYDPMLGVTKPKNRNLKLIKGEFTKNTDIKDYDLIIGILPCDTTEDIIKKACLDRKNFYIQMCGCTHFTYSQMMKYGLSADAYQKYIIDLANSILEDNVNIDKLDNKFGIDYPILYKKF